MSSNLTGQCLLVGNGTSVLDRKNGPQIDGYEHVVRFNWFKTAGFEEHVGGKTDMWFNTLMPRSCDWRLHLPYTRIYLHTWQASVEKDKLWAAFNEAFPGKPFFKVDHQILGEMAEFTGEPSVHWSTGALAIWLMLREFPQVTLTGFDWWEGRDKHHYSDGVVAGNLHQPAAEKRLLDALGDRVTFL